MRPSLQPVSLALLTLALFSAGSGPAHSQEAQAPNAAAVPAAGVPQAPAGFAIASLRPALASVQAAIGSLNIAHWKAPGATRATVEQDVASMQRDLTVTLPPLLAAADASAASAPPALSPSFAVFRNLDALYDVLLRVTETAALAGSPSDASGLEDARAALEESRGRLGVWLLQSIGAQDAQIARSHTPVSASPPSPPAAPNKIVVNDGPDTPKPRKKKPPPPQLPQ
jgi:hypothetical protein